MSDHTGAHKGGRSGAAFTRSPSGVFGFGGGPTPGVIIYKNRHSEEPPENPVYELKHYNFDKDELTSFETAEIISDLRYIKFGQWEHWLMGVSNLLGSIAFGERTADFIGFQFSNSGDNDLLDIAQFFPVTGTPFNGFGQDSIEIEDPNDNPVCLRGEFAQFHNRICAPFSTEYLQSEPGLDAEVNTRYYGHASGFTACPGATGDILSRSAKPEFNEHWKIFTQTIPGDGFYVNVSGYGGNPRHYTHPFACEFDPLNARLYVSFSVVTYAPRGSGLRDAEIPDVITGRVYHFGYYKAPDESHDNWWGYTAIYQSSTYYIPSIDFKAADPDGLGGVFGLLVGGGNTRFFYYDGTGAISIFKTVTSLVKTVRWSGNQQKLFFHKKELNTDDPPVFKWRIYTCDADGTNDEMWLEYEELDENIFWMECID